MNPRATVAVIIAALGCASANVMRLDNTVRPATSPDSIALLLEEPNRPYTAIALIEVSDESWGLSLETLRDKLLDEAATLGAHAVILTQKSTQSGGVLVPVGNTWFLANTEERRLVGKVIVFTDSQRR